jgi:hypothetical protein
MDTKVERVLQILKGGVMSRQPYSDVNVSCRGPSDDELRNRNRKRKLSRNSVSKLK